MFSKLRNKILLTIMALTLLIIPCVVLASNSIEVFNVAESSGSTYSQLPIIATVNNNQLISSGLISSSGLNTQVALGGIAVPRMLTDSKTLFISNILANTSNDFVYGTKDTPDTSMPIIVGNGGYITEPYEVPTELGSSFTKTIVGYVDTSIPVTTGNTVASGTVGVVTGTPVTLANGSNTVPIGTVGDIVVTLSNGISASVASGSTTVTGSPVQIGQGKNTITTTGSTGNITITLNENKIIDAKVGSYQLSVDNTTSGTVDAALTLPTVSQTSASAGVSMYSGSVVRAGERFTSIPANSIITAISWNLAKNNSPTGTGTVTVRKSSDDTLLGTLGTVDVSTIFGGYVVFNTTPVSIGANTDIRIDFEYSGGSVGNSVYFYRSGSDVYANGSYTSYTGSSWTDNASYDACWQNLAYATTVSIAGVATGVHTITTSLTGGTFSLAISGSTTATIAFAGSVATNTNTWTINQNNVMPYITSYAVKIGSTDELLYQPSTVIIGTTLVDTINGYNGTITFGSNPAGITVTNKSFPTINTVSAINPTTSSVTLNANLTSLGAYSSASVWFDYGTDTSYGDSTSNVSYSALGAITQTATSGLIPNTTYHFRAAVSPDGLAADASYGSDMTFSTVLSTTTSKTIKINAVGLFPNYKDAGDLLVVAEVYCDWSGLSPTSDPSQNFVLQLKDPTNTYVIAQDPLLQWGDRPQAIYLSPSLASTLTQGGAYYIVLVPTFAVGAPAPFPHVVTPTEWTQDLYTWCIGVAKDMAGYDHVDISSYVVSSTDNNEVITDEDGGYFTTGIPLISTILPNLFQVTKSQVKHTIGGSNDQWTGNHVWNTKVGSLVASDFGVIGNLFYGDTNHGQVVMGYMLLLVVVVICVIGVGMGGKGLPLLILSFPITLWGAEMGAIAYQWLLVPCVAMVILWARQFWVKPT